MASFPLPFFNPNMMGGRNATMMGRDAPLNVDPLVPVLRRALGTLDLLRPLKVGIDCLDSGPFLNVCWVSLKSAPYAFYGSQSLIKEFDNPISCRLRYLESAFMSVAGVVYNFVFATAFTVLSLVTLAQVKEFTEQMQKRWVHTGLSVGSVAIGLIGTISPQLGIQANLAAVLGVGIVLFQWVESDVIRNISVAYQRHREEFRRAGVECAHGDNAFFNREIAPFFDYLDTHLQNAHSFSNFITVVQGAADRVHVPFYASPTVLIDNAMQLFDQWRIRQDVTQVQENVYHMETSA